MPQNQRKKTANGSADPEVVRTEDLVRVLRAWINRHEEGRHYLDAQIASARLQRAAQMGEDAPTVIPMTGQQYICHWSGIQPRVLQRILGGSSKHTTYTLADVLLTSVGIRLEDELEILPNPQRSRNGLYSGRRKKTRRKSTNRRGGS